MDAKSFQSTQTKRDTELKWNGWGYKDSYFHLNSQSMMEMAGERYELSQRELSNFNKFAWDKQHINFAKKYLTGSKAKVENVPRPALNEPFMKWIVYNKIVYSLEDRYRVNRSHGQLVDEIIDLRLGKCSKRIPDVVVWPKSHKEVVEIVKTANDADVVIIPIGGGTSVTRSLTCPDNETRSIVSLDVCLMNKILNIDKQNMCCTAECGISGTDLEEQLNEQNLTMGHEPDSSEFSTLGGWVSTRASGIRKNKYGNIEDLVISVTVVTPNGTIVNSTKFTRTSSGPNLIDAILGSEGTLGVITHVTFKIHHITNKKFFSFLFPNFLTGFKFLREIAEMNSLPAAVRFHDNVQTMLGIAMLPKPIYIREYLVQFGWAFVIPYIFGFNLQECCGATVLYEGSDEEVNQRHKILTRIAKKHKALKGTEVTGRNGYKLINCVAYLRDHMLNYSCVADSFETSVEWAKVLTLIDDLKDMCVKEAKRYGVVHPIYLTCRITQVYHTGVCIYFYIVFNYQDMFPGMSLEERIESGSKMFTAIEMVLINEVLARGGSISHHHGVGKLKKRHLPGVIGDIGISVLQAVKQTVDPKNIFACGNLYDVPSKL